MEERSSDIKLLDNIEQSYNMITDSSVKQFLEMIANALRINKELIIIKSISFASISQQDTAPTSTPYPSNEVSVENFGEYSILESFSNDLYIDFEIGDQNFITEMVSPIQNSNDYLNSRLSNLNITFIEISDSTASPSMQNTLTNFNLTTLSPESNVDLVENCNEWKCNEFDKTKMFI